MTVKKNDQQVTDILAGYQGFKFDDILNQLWLTGVDPNKLKDALATSNNGTNDPSDIVARLLNKNIVTVDQLKAAQAAKPANPLPPQAYPFTDRQDGKDAQGKPISVPVHTNMYTPSSPTGLPQAAITTPSAPAVTIPTAATPTAGTSTAKTVQTVTAPQPGQQNTKPIDTSTPEGIAEYEKQNFSSMLWVNDTPELKGIIEQAAKEKWTPDRFQAQIQSSDWWKQHSDTARAYVKLRSDDATYKQTLGTTTAAVQAYASQFGIPMSDQDASAFADKALQMGWNTDPNMLKKQVVNTATYNAQGQGGALGTNMETVKNTARNYFTTISDQDAFNMAKQLGMGDIDQATITGNMAQKAKAAWPSLANLIDQGVAPRDAMSNQINTAAQLLEIDPQQVDPTDPKFQKMISTTDDKGLARPMTVDETSRFVKGMTDYWNTDNAKTEVSNIVSSLGTMFGKQALG